VTALVKSTLGVTAAQPRSMPPRTVAEIALAQFVSGWHDLDLRDATGLGNGALLLRAGTEIRDRWLSRLATGDLVGIAATERHGGSRIQEITTRATLTAGGRWLISGENVWVSRLVEAHGMAVFPRDPDGRISAAIVSAGAPGLSRETVTPAGLAGWSLAVFRDHFARFRPLVTATALGAAVGVHTAVTEALAVRVQAGVLPRVRDNALITIGRTHADLTAALLNTLATVQLGAAGFTAASPLAKARADLAALQYTDGIHDSLYRSGSLRISDRREWSMAVSVTCLRRGWWRAAPESDRLCRHHAEGNGSEAASSAASISLSPVRGESFLSGRKANSCSKAGRMALPLALRTIRPACSSVLISRVSVLVFLTAYMAAMSGSTRLREEIGVKCSGPLGGSASKRARRRRLVASVAPRSAWLMRLIQASPSWCCWIASTCSRISSAKPWIAYEANRHTG
jgi:hypothetical protein